MLPRLRLLPILLSLLASTAFGWVDSGHMVVGAIAYRHLHPKVRGEVDRLLRIGGDPRTAEFITATCWADDIKHDRPETAKWHYIDIPFKADGTTPSTKPDPQNVVWAINRFSAILHDFRQTDADRAEALRFLLHFVGDIHQPLHATTRETPEHPDGDAGGNRFRIEPPAMYASDDRPPHNLHIIWDLGCGLLPETHRDFRPLTPESRAQIEAIATKVEVDEPLAKTRVKQTDPMGWAEESFEKAKEVVYSLPEGSSPSDAYMARGRQLCEERIALAGLRLANLLNQLLD
jgi:hypothetical protein